ncbi:MAG: hypothetical protein ABIQ88_18345 [Chitinophagaceae bacterium]
MAVEKYSIGGVVSETEAFEAFADIPQNRVLMAEKLTVKTPVRPEIVEGLTNIEMVFDKFKPEVDAEFEDEEGISKKEVLRFKSLGDFGIKGITAQSNFISDLAMKKDQYQKIIKQLKNNKNLQKALKNKDTKDAFINALHALIKELEQPKEQTA